ncbi:MAG: Rossmann-like and DUF2520 domain-containing protein [Rikenellaceae bacterium]
MRVVIIGSGSVAEALAIGVASANSNKVILTQIFGRNEQRVNRVAMLSRCKNRSTNPADLAKADLYILAVSDSSIAELATTLPFANGAIVAHTAGSVSLDILPQTTTQRRAVIYPMQTFTKGRRLDFREIPLFIEADDQECFTMVRSVAKVLSNNVVKLSSERRRSLHMGAVFASNFVNAMYAASSDILAKHDLPLALYEPLIRETLSKAMLPNVHPMQMQSGPAVRGDRETIEKHIELLKESPELIEVYKTISKYIWETSKRI